MFVLDLNALVVPEDAMLYCGSSMYQRYQGSLYQNRQMGTPGVAGDAITSCPWLRSGQTSGLLVTSSGRAEAIVCRRSNPGFNN